MFFSLNHLIQDLFYSSTSQIYYLDDLEVSNLDAMMKEFESTANAGNHGEHGWHNSTYSGENRIESKLKIRIHHEMDPPEG